MSQPNNQPDSNNNVNEFKNNGYNRFYMMVDRHNIINFMNNGININNTNRSNDIVRVYIRTEYINNLHPVYNTNSMIINRNIPPHYLYR